MLLSPKGIIPLSANDAITKAQQILIDAYGTNVNLDPSTTNGLLVQQIANSFLEYDANMIKVMYTLDPNVADGYSLDSILANFGAERTPASKSTATCQITGLSGTYIPLGSQLRSVNGNLFSTVSNVTIGLSGTANVGVQAVEGGAIHVVANTITSIVTLINGWDTVNNPTSGTVGSPAQTDSQIRANINDIQYFSSSNSVQSVLAGATSIAGIKAYNAIDNRTTQEIVIDNITLNPISILFIADGGSDADIANMLYQRTCIDTSGNTSYNVTIPNTIYTQTIRFERPTVQTLQLKIKFQQNINYSPTLSQDIATIMNNQFNFNLIGRIIYATDIIELLYNNGISPIVQLTFDFGAVLDKNEYLVPINQAIRQPMTALDIIVSF